MNAVPSRDHRMKHMTMFPANWLTLSDDRESVCFIRISGGDSSRSQQRSSYVSSRLVTTNAARIRMRHLMIVESTSSNWSTTVDSDDTYNGSAGVAAETRYARTPSAGQRSSDDTYQEACSSSAITVDSYVSSRPVTTRSTRIRMSHTKKAPSSSVSTGVDTDRSYVSYRIFSLTCGRRGSII